MFNTRMTRQPLRMVVTDPTGKQYLVEISDDNKLNSMRELTALDRARITLDTNGKKSQEMFYDDPELYKAANKIKDEEGPLVTKL